jgi:hypothetical protein
MRALEKSERERERTEVALAMYDSKKRKIDQKKKVGFWKRKERREDKVQMISLTSDSRKNN